MLTRFFSRKGIVSSTAIAIAVSSQIVWAPVALAQGRQALLNQYVRGEIVGKTQALLQQAEADGYEVYDASHQRLAIDRFVDEATGDFFLVSPPTDGDAGFSYKVHVRQPGDGSAIVSLVVTRPGETRVLARRAITVDYRQDPASVRLAMAQTEAVLENQLRREVAPTHASLWQRTQSALAGIFGIPTAHAGALSLGVKVAIGFAGVGVLLLALDGVAQYEGWIQSKYVPIGILVAIAAGALFTYLSFGSPNEGSGPIGLPEPK